MGEGGAVTEMDDTWIDEHWIDWENEAKAAIKAINEMASLETSNAYYAGFVECSKHTPWDDMFDWAALKSLEYAKNKSHDE